MTERSGKPRRPKNEEGDEDQLSEEELAREQGAPLPDRAALSTLSTDVAIPVNPALAADVLAGPEDDLGEPVESDEDEDEDKDKS